MKTLLPLNAHPVERGLDSLAHERLNLDLSPLDTRPLSCPENLLPWLAAQWRVDIAGLTVTQQRALINNALEIHRYKGTAYAVKKALSAVFDDASLIEHRQPFYFDAKVQLQADTTAVYDSASFDRARSLVNHAKNARSRLGHFDVRFPDAQLPLNSSIACATHLTMSADIHLKRHANIHLTGALQWTL